MSDENLHKAFGGRSEKYFHSVIDKDTILIAEDKHIIIGFIQFGAVTIPSIKTNDEDIELNKIYVRTDQHGKGIGKKLMESMLSHQRLENVERIYLDVYGENKKAIGLYEKYGFSIIGKTPFIADNKIIGYDLLMQYSKKQQDQAE